MGERRVGALTEPCPDRRPAHVDPLSNRNPCRSHHRRHSRLAVVAQRNPASSPPASIAGPADATRMIRSARSMSRPRGRPAGTGVSVPRNKAEI